MDRNDNKCCNCDNCTYDFIGDHIILLGGRTGRDGLRGATFSSMTMDAQTGEVAGASVQIGNPLIAKGLIEVDSKGLIDASKNQARDITENIEMISSMIVSEFFMSHLF